MTRILFLSENITLAQVVRLLALAERLPTERFEVHFACGNGHDWLFAGKGFRRWPLFTVRGDEALAALARGQRLYDERTLQRYVVDELRIIDAVKPDVIVGDFRLSLAVSARVAGVHCASLINAYWSPYAERDGFPMPDHPLVRLFGVERAERYFPRALPHVFAHFAAPLNAVRKRYGMKPASLLEQLCFGDTVLYPDIPELCPLRAAPATHVFLGAVPWAPLLPLPNLKLNDDSAVPLVYVTLGSSGDTGALPAVLDALGKLPIRGVLATAGSPAPSRIPSNFQVFEYVPGDELSRRARFVVTNGGSSTGYQALAAGAPVIGLPSNLDQYLAMQSIERVGAGLTVRAASAEPDQVRDAAAWLIEDDHTRARANEIARRFAMYDCHDRFQAWLGALLAALLLLFPRAITAEETYPINTVEFESQNNNDDGVVRCGLFKQDGWLKDAFRASVVRLHNKRGLCIFKGVPPGVYGASAFHDEDNDGKLDTNLVGYPMEEYCATNNARNLMSAPSWKDAKFVYRGGTVRLRCVMK